MDHQKLLLEVKDEFIWLVKNVEASTAMGLFDVHRISEKVVLPLFQTIMGWPDLRNLNEEKEDYPAIDLGDEVKQIGIQISGTTTLTKVKNTLAKFLNHDLDKTYTRVIVYVLTNKQQSYFQKAIDEVVGSRLAFNAKTDILDYTDLLKKAAKLTPEPLLVVWKILKSYRHAEDPAHRPVWLLRTEVSQEEIPPFTPRWLFFAERKIPLLGRGGDLDVLADFMESPSPFSWWTLCGPAGIGKTRLAHELELKYKDNWYCGFTDAKNLPTVEQLQQLQRPTLLVFDYAARDSEALKALLRMCCALGDSLSSKLRVLLLEREANENADWWKELVLTESTTATLIRNNQYQAPRELTALSAQAGEILRAWLEAGAPAVVEQLPPPSSPFWTQVMHVSEGRPLLIALIAGTFSRAPNDTHVPALRELLLPVLQREAQRWKTRCNDTGLFPRLVQLLAVATLIRGLDILQEDHRVLVRTGDDESDYLLVKDPKTQTYRIPTVEDLRQHEHIFELLSTQQQQLWDDLAQLIPATQLAPTTKAALEVCPPRGILQPDLIGEFFIDELWRPQMQFAPATALPTLTDASLEAILSSAWTLHPYNLLQTLDALKKTTICLPGYLRLLDMLTAVACKVPTTHKFALSLLARLLYNAMIKLGTQKPSAAQINRTCELLSRLAQHFPADREVAYRQLKALMHLIVDPVKKQVDVARARAVNLEARQFVTEVIEHPDDKFELFWGDAIVNVAMAAIQNHHEEMLAEALVSAQILQTNFGASSELNTLLARLYKEVAKYLSEPLGDTYSLSSQLIPLAKRCLPLLAPQVGQGIEQGNLDQPFHVSSTWALVNIMYAYAKLKTPAKVLELHPEIERYVARVSDPAVAIAMEAKAVFNAQTARLLENDLRSALALASQIQVVFNVSYSNEAGQAHLSLWGRSLSLTLAARDCEGFLGNCEKLFTLCPLLSDDDGVVWMLAQNLQLIREGIAVLSIEQICLAKFTRHLSAFGSQTGRCTNLFFANTLTLACKDFNNKKDDLRNLEQLFLFVKKRLEFDELSECLYAALFDYWISKGKPASIALFGCCEISSGVDSNLRIRITADDLSVLSDKTMKFISLANP